MAAKRAASQQRDFFVSFFWSQKREALVSCNLISRCPPHGGGTPKAAAYSDFLYSLGVHPTYRKKQLPKWLGLLKPVNSATSAMLYAEFFSKISACWMRYCIKNSLGGIDVYKRQGLECMGEVDEAAQAEVLRLALASLAALDVPTVLEVSHMGFVTGLLDVLDVPATTHARLVELLCAKNEHELRKAALQAGADEAGADALCGLLTLHGPFGATLTAAKAAAISPSQKAALAELLALQNALGEAGRGLQLDLSMADEAEYYNGIIFTGYAAGIPRAVLKGGQYDYLMQRFTPGAKAIGFAMYLDELERLAAPLPPVQQQGGEKTWLNIALPKGRLGDKAYALLAGAGYSANEDYNDTRKLVVENPEAGVRYFLVKPSDVAIYVEHGAADIGIVGKDILTESGADVYELLDTGMGKCRMCVAGPKNFVDDESRALRVATKFVNIARDHYERRGRDIDIVKLNGSIELAPILGLSDVIVDIVETGTTLKENDLTVIEEFMPISARFIANKASYKFKYAQLTELLTKMKEALAQ